ATHSCFWAASSGISPTAGSSAWSTDRFPPRRIPPDGGPQRSFIPIVSRCLPQIFREVSPSYLGPGEAVIGKPMTPCPGAQVAPLSGAAYASPWSVATVGPAVPLRGSIRSRRGSQGSGPHVCPGLRAGRQGPCPDPELLPADRPRLQRVPHVVPPAHLLRPD